MRIPKVERDGGGTPAWTGAEGGIEVADLRRAVVRRRGAETMSRYHVRNFPQTRMLVSWTGRSARNC
jgi:hypothetical protein